MARGGRVTREVQGDKRYVRRKKGKFTKSQDDVTNLVLPLTARMAWQ